MTADTGVILSMRPANERRRYNVTSSLVGWAHAQTDIPLSTVSGILPSSLSVAPHIHRTPGYLTTVGVRHDVSGVFETGSQLGRSVFISTIMSKIFPDGSVRPNDGYAVSGDDIADAEDNRKASLEELLWRPVTLVILLPGTNQISLSKHNCCAIETTIFPWFSITTMLSMSQHGDNLLIPLSKTISQS